MTESAMRAEAWLLRGLNRNSPRALVLVCLAVGLALVGLVLTASVIDLHDVQLAPYQDADDGSLLNNFLVYLEDSRTNIPGFVPVSGYGYGPLHGSLGILAAQPLRAFMSDSVALWLGVRLLSIVSGIASLIVLWRMVRRHFGVSLAAVAVLSLALTPEFVRWFDHLKPEMLTLLLIFLSLYLALSLTETFRMRTLFWATACAAAVFATKFFGFVLLPSVAIGAAFGLGWGMGPEQFRTLIDRWRRWFIVFGLLAAVGAFVLAVVPFAVILLYTREATGATWYATDGLFAPLAQPEFFEVRLVFPAAGMSLLASILLLVAARQRDIPGDDWRRWAGILAVVVLASILSFAAASVVLFYGWLSDIPGGVRYLTGISEFYYTRSGEVDTNPTFDTGWFNLAVGRGVVGWLGVLLLGAYMVTEAVWWRRLREVDPVRQVKRLVLFLFIATYFISLFVMVSRLAGWYLLPIIPLSFVLGLDVLRAVTRDRSVQWRQLAGALVVVLVIADLAWRGSMAFDWRVNSLQKPDDIALAMGEWLEDRYPSRTTILSDIDTETYIPSSFSEVVYIQRYLDSENDLQSAGSNAEEYVAADAPTLIVLRQGTDDPRSLELARLVESVDYEVVRTFEGLHRSRTNGVPAKFAVFERIN